jgi:CelD/BcsL family acetyltransferase involved in cellulose biosynthesis
LELPGTWEALLSGLGPSRRRNIRRYERQLREQHDVVLTEYGQARLEEGWHHLQRLHGRRWGGEGVFRESVMERLHRCFGAWLAERGQLWLVTLDLDGAPAAAWYGFSLGDTHHAYQMGWDTRYERQSVGTVLMGLMIRRAIECGYRKFDFLRGEEAYKIVWTGTARTCFEVVVTRAGWRGAVLRGLDWIARRQRKPWLPAPVRLGGRPAEQGTGM